MNLAYFVGIADDNVYEKNILHSGVETVMIVINM